MRREIAEGGEYTDRVDVHGELQPGEVVASKNGKETVDARDLVDKQRQGNHLGSGAQRDEVKECLLVVSVRAVA